MLPVRILNFDDSVLKQKALLTRYQAEIIDLEYLAGRARLWMNARTREIIRSRLRNLAKNAITFLGSGDFHHVSSILINQIAEPVTLIVFDLHPDWDTLPPRLGCGAWVTEALKNKNILKCLLIGISSTDISTWHLQSANLGSLRDNRLEIYPYIHSPSSVFLKSVPQNISITCQKTLGYRKIFWQELKGKNLPDFFLSIIKRLPVNKVYVSIDKDCLKKEYSLTNWEEGNLMLDELLLMLRLIKENLEIIGADITGDYSRERGLNWLKSFCSKCDHPEHFSAAGVLEPLISATNEQANLKILGLLNS